jgi:hypothetical protein
MYLPRLLEFPLTDRRVPDIMRHMSNMIVRAEKEVYLATNYWQNSVASAYITNAMKELSARAGKRGEKIVMKIIYDRGSPKQLLEPHYIVSEKEYLGKTSSRFKLTKLTSCRQCCEHPKA